MENLRNSLPMTVIMRPMYNPLFYIVAQHFFEKKSPPFRGELPTMHFIALSTTCGRPMRIRSTYRDFVKFFQPLRKVGFGIDRNFAPLQSRLGRAFPKCACFRRQMHAFQTSDACISEIEHACLTRELRAFRKPRKSCKKKRASKTEWNRCQSGLNRCLKSGS